VCLYLPICSVKSSQSRDATSNSRVTSMIDALTHSTSMNYDDLGRLNTVIGADGSQQRSVIYDPAGLVTNVTDGAGRTSHFVYDPQSGRFLSRDPLMGNGMMPLTLNGYAYAGNDPINSNDYSGLAYDLVETSFVMGMIPLVRQNWDTAKSIGTFAGDLAGADYSHPADQAEAMANAEHLMSSTLNTTADIVDGVSPIYGMALRLISAGTTTYIQNRDIIDTLLDPYADAEAKQFARLALANKAANFVVESVLSYAENGIDQGMDMAIKSWDTGDADDVAEDLLTAAVDMGKMVKKYTVGKGSVQMSHVSRDVGEPYQREGLCEKNDCFIAGTEILLGSGLTKSIEQIKVGDIVSSLNIETGKLEKKRVTQTFKSVTDELRELHIGDNIYIVTPDHPFLTTHGWVEAADLGIGTEIVTRAGPRSGTKTVSWNVAVKASERENIFFGYDTNTGGYTVYNIEVQDLHNYVVGEKHGKLGKIGGSQDGLGESEGDGRDGSVVHNSTIKRNSRGRWYNASNGQFVKTPAATKLPRMQG
jgi:RHS repeat-associated protein